MKTTYFNTAFKRIRSLMMSSIVQGALLFIVFLVFAKMTNIGVAFGILVASSFFLNLSLKPQNEVTVGVTIALLFCCLFGLVLAPESMIFLVPIVLVPFVISYITGLFLACVIKRLFLK